jgi:hypothetical protein
MADYYSLSSPRLHIDQEEGSASVEFTIRSGPYSGATVSIPVQIPGSDQDDSHSTQQSQLQHQALEQVLLMKFGTGIAQLYLAKTTPAQRSRFITTEGIDLHGLVADVEEATK